MSGTSSVVVTPTDDSAARRTVARAMRLGLYIWPTFTALDAFARREIQGCHCG
jgi:hypothetical protein